MTVPPSAVTDPVWPQQSWFLRGPLLSTAVIIAAAAALVTEFSVMVINGEHPIGYLGLALSAMGLLVVLRARWVGLALTTVGAVVSALWSSEYVGIWTVTVFAMFLFARERARVLPAVAPVALALYLSLVARSAGQFDAPPPLVAATFCVAAAAAGSVVRLQAESWHAARQHAADLAATQVVELRQAVADERVRIARDLHDVVGHELAVVNMSLGVAEVSLPPGSDAARTALVSARDGLQRTLQETQQILALLRAVDTGADERSELPQAAHIASLVDRVRRAGVDVDACIEAPLPDLDADVSAAAYRIVQEALTNAERHGAGGVTLTLSINASGLVIDIRNPVSVPARPLGGSGGYGIVGMRERTHAAGGSLDVSSNDSVFTVHVELPTKEAGR